MERYPRDLLCRIGRSYGFLEQGPLMPQLTVQGGGGGEEEVELSLGLSLGGRFGVDPKGNKLERSSSIASILPVAVELEEVPLVQTLARTSSLPTETAEERRKRREVQTLKRLERRNSVGAAGLPGGRPKLDLMAEAFENGMESCHENGIGMVAGGLAPEAQPAVKSQGSGSFSSGSSDGEGQKVEVNVTDTLMRTSSLPAGIDNEWRKRKELQSLKRLKVKRKRLERRNSLTSNTAREAVGQKLEELNVARVEKVESCNDIIANKQIGGSVNHINVKQHEDGLLPTSQTMFRSQGSNFFGMTNIQSQPLKGSIKFSEPTAHADEHNPSAVPVRPPAERTKETMVATPFALAARMATDFTRGEHNLSRRVAGRAKSMGDVDKIMMQEMPCVSTRGLGPNGKRLEGFLYKYRKGEEVRIVCVCHGSFLTPAEFVKHAGGEDVTHPLRHIVVNPFPSSFL